MPRTRTGRRETTEGALVELQRSVDALIEENRRLKREIARLERSGGAASTVSDRALRSLQRRLERAMPVAASTGRRRQPARKVTDPEVLARRRAALEKARAARAAKRAAEAG